MKLCGMIAEYNPFHNGHLYQLQQIKKTGATHIAAVMSGNFVQRGDVGIFSKWARAEACLRNGVDLVIELPTTAAMAPAKDFAFAGVFLLKCLGAQSISFGSECGDAEKLKQAAVMVEQAENSILMREGLQSGLSYPKAREQSMLRQYGKEWTDLIVTPNNLLGIEYLRAAQKLAVDLQVHTVLREGAFHDGIGAGNITSASHLRRMILESGLETAKRYLPQSAYEIYDRELKKGTAPCSVERFTEILHYRLRSVSASELSEIRDIAEGLERRMIRESSEWIEFENLVGKICSKRYTRARVRRIMMNLLLNIKKDAFNKLPEYIRVLGANKNGMEILREMKAKGMPYFMKFSAINQRGFPQAFLEARATDLYSLSMPKPAATGMEFRNNPVVIYE